MTEWVGFFLNEERFMMWGNSQGPVEGIASRNSLAMTGWEGFFLDEERLALGRYSQ